MIDLIKKAMFTGIGVASLTKEKIEDVAQEFVEKGKLTESEGKKLVDELVVKSEESKEDVKKQVEELVNSSLEKMNIAKSSDIDELKSEIQALKEQIAAGN